MIDENRDRSGLPSLANWRWWRCLCVKVIIILNLIKLNKFNFYSQCRKYLIVMQMSPQCRDKPRWLDDRLSSHILCIPNLPVPITAIVDDTSTLLSPVPKSIWVRVPSPRSRSDCVIRWTEWWRWYLTFGYMVLSNPNPDNPAWPRLRSPWRWLRRQTSWQIYWLIHFPV